MLVSRLQGIRQPCQECIAKTFPRILPLEICEPVMHLAELCIRLHFRARPSLLPHRETQVAPLSGISDLSESKPPPVSSRRDEDRRSQLRRERRAVPVPGYHPSLPAWRGRAAYARGLRAEWASRLSAVGRLVAYSHGRKGRCCSRSCSGYRQCCWCETRVPRVR